MGVSIDNVFRKKRLSKKLVVGDYTKQYELLRGCVLELHATNTDITIKIHVYSKPNHAFL